MSLSLQGWQGLRAVAIHMFGFPDVTRVRCLTLGMGVGVSRF